MAILEFKLLEVAARESEEGNFKMMDRPAVFWEVIFHDLQCVDSGFLGPFTP